MFTIKLKRCTSRKDGHLAAFFSRNPLGEDAIRALISTGASDIRIVAENDTMVELEYQWGTKKQFDQSEDFFAKHGVERIYP